MATTLSARRHYRKSTKRSGCRGKTRGTCRNARAGCTITKRGQGSRARAPYCRKKHISRRKHY